MPIFQTADSLIAPKESAVPCNAPDQTPRRRRHSNTSPPNTKPLPQSPPGDHSPINGLDAHIPRRSASRTSSCSRWWANCSLSRAPIMRAPSSQIVPLQLFQSPFVFTHQLIHHLAVLHFCFEAPPTCTSPSPNVHSAGSFFSSPTHHRCALAYWQTNRHPDYAKEYENGSAIPRPDYAWPRPHQIPMPIQVAVRQTLDYFTVIYILLKRLQSGTCGFIRPTIKAALKQFANPNPRLAQRPQSDSGSRIPQPSGRYHNSRPYVQ